MTDEPLRQYDVVRVARLRTAARKFDGARAVRRSPRVGDVATIVHEYNPSDARAPVAVEMVDSDGFTVWLADFYPDEIEMLQRP